MVKCEVFHNYDVCFLYHKQSCFSINIQIFAPSQILVQILVIENGKAWGVLSAIHMFKFF